MKDRTGHTAALRWRAGKVMDEDRSMSDATVRWTRSTVYADMWVDPDDDPREVGASGTDERGILTDYLRRYRLTLQMSMLSQY